MKYPLLLTISLLAFAAGCGSELETGYKPQRIGVSTDERRAYYAPAFSPEQEAGRNAEDSVLKARRPNPNP